MPKLSEKHDLEILTRLAVTDEQREEQNMVKWLQDHKDLINVNQIEKKAGCFRAISLVLANQPNRRLISHLDKIIPIVSKLGYNPVKHPKNGTHNEV
jgi:hypothetical protein